MNESTPRRCEIPREDLRRKVARRGYRAQRRGVKERGRAVEEGVGGGWKGARHLRVEPAVDLEG
jgi:hypothetical protein